MPILMLIFLKPIIKPFFSQTNKIACLGSSSSFPFFLVRNAPGIFNLAGKMRWNQSISALTRHFSYSVTIREKLEWWSPKPI